MNCPPAMCQLLFWVGYALSHVVLANTLQSRYDYLQFVDAETESQQNEETYAKSQSS